MQKTFAVLSADSGPDAPVRYHNYDLPTTTRGGPRWFPVLPGAARSRVLSRPNAARGRLLMQRHTPIRPAGRFADSRADATRQEQEQRTKAMRTVADHATDAQDCADLLGMLGLDEADRERSPVRLGQIP